MPLAIDLLNPSVEDERRKHKLKRLVQHPNSFFMDVKCPGCFNITTVFSHAQNRVICSRCATYLCQPTGGKSASYGRMLVQEKSLLIPFFYQNVFF